MNPPPRAGRTRMIRERTAVGVDLNPTSKRMNITSAGALRPSSAWPTARNARSMFKILAGGVFDAAFVLDARVDEQPIFSPPRQRRIRARPLPRDQLPRSSPRLMTTESDALAGGVHRRRPARSPFSLPARASRRIQRGRVEKRAQPRTD